MSAVTVMQVIGALGIVAGLWTLAPWLALVVLGTFLLVAGILVEAGATQKDGE